MFKKIFLALSLILLFTGCAGEVNTPKLELIGSKEVSLIVGEKYVESGCIAEDKEDGNLTSKIKISGWNGDTTKVGSYTITYVVIDSDGHEEYTTRTVKVIAKVS